MYHMKRDESGVAICNASVKDCPNGAFGHWETADEVWTAYEESNFDKTLAKTLNKDEIKKKSRKDRAEEKKEALKMLKNAQDDEDRDIALSMIPANDYIWDKFADSSKKDERLWAAKKINANKTATAIIDFIEYEEDPDVLCAFAKNPTLEEEQAKKIYNKLKKLKIYDFQDQHFIIDYTRTVQSMKDDSSETIPTKKAVPNASQTTSAQNTHKPQNIESSPSAPKTQSIPERPQKEKVVPHTQNRNSERPQPVNKSRKTPLQKVADSQKAARMVVSPEFGRAFNKATENMRDDIRNTIRDKNVSPEQRKAAESVLRVLSETKFAGANKKNILLQGGTEVFALNTTNGTDLSKIPDGLVKKHIGKIFEQNDIEYSFKKTNKSLEFHFVTKDDFDKLEFDLNMKKVS